MGVGPDIITKWTPGVSMTFAANPFFFLGAPATPQITVEIVDSGTLEAKLLDGSVDIPGPDSLWEVNNTLRNADTAGTIDLSVLLSTAWDHLDINLNIFFYNYLPGIARS
jgi:ABC-type transport system substrate-binding protein